MFFIICLLACISMCSSTPLNSITYEPDESHPIPTGIKQLPITKLETDICYYDATKRRDLCTKIYAPTAPNPLQFEAHTYEKPSSTSYLSYKPMTRSVGDFEDSTEEYDEYNEEELQRYTNHPTHVIATYVPPNNPNKSKLYPGPYYPTELGNSFYKPSNHKHLAGQGNMNSPHYNQAVPQSQPLYHPIHGPVSYLPNRNPNQMSNGLGQVLPGIAKVPPGYQQVPQEYNPSEGYGQISQPGAEYIYMDPQIVHEDEGDKIVDYEYFDPDEFVYIPKKDIQKLLTKKPGITYINSVMGLKK